MIDESLSFLRVRDLPRGPAASCSPADDLVVVARRMCEAGVSGIVVIERDVPVGIISDQDIRSALAEAGSEIGAICAGKVMQSPLVTIGENDYAFEAIYKMARFGIHRLIVVNADGALSRVITDADVISLQTHSPLYLNREIERAGSLVELKEINGRLLEMVSFANRAGAGTRDVVRLISHFNDAVTQRVIRLLEKTEGLSLPRGAAYLVLGSEGRGEQTLRTDQDSAVVYGNGLTAAELAGLERFSIRLIEALIQIGVPPCPGGTMANNPQWRRSLEEWKRSLEKWITTPTASHMVNFGMFQDLRVLHGDKSLEKELHGHILTTTRRNSLFFPYVARNIVRFPPPLGLFGRIRVERKGKQQGTVDLKKAGIFALTEGVSLLALEAGILGGSTWEKIEALRAGDVLPALHLDRVEDAFTYLVGLRLQRQLEALRSGAKPSNYVYPAALTARELEHFREALQQVGNFLRLIRDRYQLDFISR